MDNIFFQQFSLSGLITSFAKIIMSASPDPASDTNAVVDVRQNSAAGEPEEEDAQQNSSSSNRAPPVLPPATSAVATPASPEQKKDTPTVDHAANNAAPPGGEETVKESPKKVAVVSASNAPPPPPRQMTREEFLRQMGLAPDDLVEQPSPSRVREDIVSPPKASQQDQPPQLAGDAPEVIQDDQWVRSTVFTDVTLIQSGATDLVANDAKKAILDSYRASRSAGAGISIDGASGDVVVSSPAHEQRAQEMVTSEDHALASEYKSALLEEFRKRKKLGEVKERPSPSRQRAAELPTPSP